MTASTALSLSRRRALDATDNVDPAIAGGFRLRSHDVALAVIVLAGTALRLRQWWWARSIWSDEAAVGIQIIHDSYGQLTKPLGGNQGAPIGWLWAEHTSVLLFGSGERSLRLVPLLSGLLTLVLLAHLARRHLPPYAGAVALAAVVLTEPSAYYANEVKQYSTDMAVALAIMIATLVVQRTPSRRRIAGWVVVILVGLQFSHPAVLVAAGCFLSVLVRAFVTRREALVPLAVATAVWLALFAVDYVAVLRALTKNEALEDFWASGFAPKPLAAGTALTWLRGDLVSLVGNPLGLGAASLVLVLAGLGLVRLLVERNEIGLPIAGTIGAAVASAVIHLYPLRERLALYLAPLLFICLGALVMPYRRRAGERVRSARPSRPARLAGLGASLAAAACLVGLFASPATATVRAIGTPTTHVEVREAIAYVLRHDQPGDVLILNGYIGTAASYYQPRLGFVVTGSETLHVGCDDRTSLQPLFAYHRIWFLTGVPGMVDDLDTPALEFAHIARVADLSNVVITPARPPAGIFPTQIGVGLATLRPGHHVGPAVGDNRCMQVTIG